MSSTPAFSCPSTFYTEFDRKGGDQHSTHYCPGCGHGLAHKYIAEALEELELADRAIFINSVGCSVFAYYYFDIGHIQVPHGRCPAAATAVKRARPDSIVIGYQGDGDLAAIGGNEIIQAANRGENLTIFFINNAIYGMTGGQLAPTTLLGMPTTTTPGGRHASNEGFPIKVCELLNTLTAPYYLERVAVGDPKHNTKTRKAIRKAISNQMNNKGFSLVEILSPCPTGWKMNPVDAAEWNLDKMVEEFPLGLFRDDHDLDLGHPRYREEVAEDQLRKMLGIDAASPGPELPDFGKPIKECRMKFSGFGGQGVIAAGVLFAQAGMLARRQVSWMPSYGPEMRGGTAHCHVTLSDEEIGSPVIHEPTVLVAMNGPSVDRFGPEVVPGGTIFYNSCMVDPPTRTDITAIPVPCNTIADRLGNPKVANVVMVGAILAHDKTLSRDAILAAIPATMKSSPELLELNRRAIDAGMEVVCQV